MMEERNFHACLNLLQNAKTDTEKFAALLMVTKSLNSSELSADHNRALFEAVGFSFLYRLLTTKQAPDGCSPEIFRSIGLSILASFSNEPELLANEKFPELIEVLKDVLNTTSAEEPMFSDALQCILGIASQPRGVVLLAEKAVASSLVDVYIKYSCKPALSTLLMLCSREGNVWMNDLDAYCRIMSKLSSDFANDNSLTKFELCEMLIVLLYSNPAKNVAFPHAKWCLQIREGLSMILRNKLIKSQRDLALKLACAAVEKFGAFWIVEESENANKFFSVLVHVVCIEVRVCLEDRNVDEVVSLAELLTTCFRILETIIVILSDEYVWHMSDENAPQLLGAIQQAFCAVTNFLIQISKSWDSYKNDTSQKAVNIRELTLACIRILSAWMAEESLALLRTDVCQVLPFLIHLAKDSLQELKNTNASHQFYSGVDVTRFLLPAMCHLTADDKARKPFLAENGLDLVYEYLQYAWNSIQNLDDIPEEQETWIATVCEVMLNVVIMEREAITNIGSGLFLNLLKFLFSTLPKLPGGNKCIILKANFAVLGLLIVKYYGKNLKSLETSFYKFLSSSIKLLWDAHNVEVAHGGGSSLEVVREYRKSWSSISELWFLGVQVLSSLLTVIPWIPTFLLETGWPQHILSCLARIGEHDIEASTRCSYENLLCSIVRNCPEAAEVFKANGASHVCSIHKLQELKTLLSSHV